MSGVATREIMWNVSSLGNVIAMYSLMVVALIIGFAGVFRHAELWASGRPAPERTGRWLERFQSLFTHGLFQRGTVREPLPAAAHTLIYVGFLVLLFTTTMVFIDHDLGIRIYEGNFYLIVTLLSDLFGLGLIIGCALFAHRRYIAKADLVHRRPSEIFGLTVLVLLCIQGFVLEGLRIHATNDPWRLWSPVGLLFAKFFWALSPESTKLLHFLTWWFHTITVFAVIAIAPYTKFFHIVASSANLYFRDSGRGKAQLQSPGDLENMMESGEEFSLGLGSIKDYTWKQLLDLDACTSCGRCQDNCPAYISGKPLSPKWMVLDTRNHALALAAEGKLAPSKLPPPLRAVDKALTLDFFLPSSGVERATEGYSVNGAYRGANELVRETPRVLGRSADDTIAGDVMDPDVFWACTTCMACVEVCPVGIDHVSMIVGNRRNMALMRGEIPAEAQPTLRALENRGNPYGAPEDRIKWLEELNVKILKPGDSVDYLYWVGCVSAFDPRKQKIARALVTLMNKAGLSFGILGTAEGCTGDPARRLGEENLFQTLAKSNIETLKSIRFQTLVANCPHCFNSIKNDYPDFGNLGEGKSPEIIHHSVLLKRLVAEEKIALKPNSEKTYTMHDPCYLGRYNNEYEAPRDTVRRATGLPILEMDRSREKGMCCGAGGGHFFMDMKKGQRVNALRVDQAAETGSNRIATACPFCMQMLEDGVKLTNREGALEVRDIAEIMVENLA
jgi:Fe-S oxidoreductase/nitrate reductase gamma subunit